MPTRFRTTTVVFGPVTGRKQRTDFAVHFPSRVLDVQAAIKGFTVGYNNGDHHIWQQEIDIDITQIEGDLVRGAVDFLLRDSSGNIDDPYSGWVEVLVIANTVT